MILDLEHGEWKMELKRVAWMDRGEHAVILLFLAAVSKMFECADYVLV